MTARQVFKGIEGLKRVSLYLYINIGSKKSC